MQIYRQTHPNHVKFQRLVMGWLAIASLFLQNIDVVWVFFAVTLLGMSVGTEYSIPTLFYKLFHLMFKRHLVHISEHHLRYYQINIPMDLIDHLLRIIASGTALLLWYMDLQTAAWLMMAFLSIFMMLSAYFGFCLSALTYIALQSLGERFKLKKLLKAGESCEAVTLKEGKHINQNCTLAKHCFTPYKRCDSCHINIVECLGTKFNSLVLIVGILMSLFLFIDNYIFIQVNIVAIMGLIFWLGYQINYNTDELAQSNNKNIDLNKQLQAYTHTLEEEVKRRTAEIEHLATHDMLTGLINRFSFEKLLNEALDHVQARPQTHLAYIDLDHFKAVNDSLGHLAGDQVLKDISNMFMRIINNSGSVARLGGDEFGILFSDISLEKAQEFCQQICDEAHDYILKWEEKEFHIGTSIGIVTVDKSMQDINALLHHADGACYKAKKLGRNQICIHQAH